SYMVNYHERLGRTFSALVDPTRRAILARLEREESASVSALAQPFVIKLPAVMKHLDVLDDAGLITRTKVGRTVTVQLRPAPIREAMDWLRRYERLSSMRSPHPRESPAGGAPMAAPCSWRRPIPRLVAASGCASACSMAASMRA